LGPYELLPKKRDSNVTGKLRDSKQYPVPWPRTERFKKSAVVYALSVEAPFVAASRILITDSFLTFAGVIWRIQMLDSLSTFFVFDSHLSVYFVY